jgi:ATP-dependent metalloprotease FtsH
MKNLFKNFIIIILIFLLISGIFALLNPQNFKKIKEVPFSQVVQDINQDKIEKIEVAGSELTLKYKSGEEAISRKEKDISLSEALLSYGADKEKLQKIEIEIGKEKEGTLSWLFPLLLFLLPLLFFGWFFWMIFRQAKAGASQTFSFLRAPAKLFGTGKTPGEKVTFKDVAGLEEAKEEIKEVVDFLKNPKKYFKMGARIPRGVLLIGPPGTGKCVRGDTLILTNKGWVKIQDIPKYFRVDEQNRVYGAEVFTSNLKTLKREKIAASHWYNLGKQKTIEITSQNGISLEGTPEHPVVIINKEGDLKFKKLEDIKLGDILVINYNHQVFGNYRILPDKKTAYLLGLILGDGGLSIKNRVYFSSKDRELVNFVREYFKKYFGLLLQKTPARKYDWFICDWRVKEKLREWGISDSYARGKEIPKSIMFGPKEYQVEFIKGLFDTDGSVNSKYSAIQIGSSSKNLISQLQVLLLNLGIVSRTRKKHSNQTGEYYHYLEITGDFCENFAKEIGFGLKRKQKELQKILLKKRNTNNNTIPGGGKKLVSLWHYIKDKKGSFPKTFYKTNIYKNLNHYKNEEKSPAKYTIDRYLAFFKKLVPQVVNLSEYKQLEKLANNSFFFSPVIDIKKSEAIVYDFTVPKEHSFIGNGLINHNTLMARAVANEAGVPFFSMSGSAFVELFVGVGQARVRSLFETAKKHQPSIIFIDELDAIGKMRMVGIGGGHEEREQTLNQILVEMDGFERDTGVIVLAASNRPELLDPALLRPGRFDRRIVLDLPDVKGREEILKIHCRGKPLALDVNLKEVAERTPGFSGADLANLVNEAAILAARRNKKQIYQEEFLESIEKVLLGPERKSHLLSKKEKEISAFHEAGHALVSTFLPEAEEVRKISIVARGLAAGYTLALPKKEKRIKTKSEFLAEIAVLLGGYCAEKLKFKEISTGAANDLEKASILARNLVVKYGMSKLGPISFGKRESLPFLGWETEAERNYSEKVASAIDKETERFIKEAERRATIILKNKKKILEKVAEVLIEKETIEKEEFEKLVKGKIKGSAKKRKAQKK